MLGHPPPLPPAYVETSGLERSLLDVQLHDVTVDQGMIRPDLLAVEGGRAPDSGETERSLDVAMHQSGHVEHGSAAPDGVGLVGIWGSAGGLRVGANDFETF